MPTDAGLADGGRSKEPGDDHRFQTRIALIGVAGGIIAATIGAVISLQPWSHPRPSPGPSTSSSLTSRCIFLTPSNVVCTSSNPEITIEFNNEADSVGCHLSDQVNWGDGAVQTFNFDGGPVGLIVLGDHKYSRKGVYVITATSNVIGQCSESFSTFPGRYSFTLD